MLVNITRSFAFGGREYVAGQNPDVDPQIARQWIADGRATADADNSMDWPSPALQALASGAGDFTARATALIAPGDGKTLTTDGPFAETREQLGGYYLIEAKDLDTAIAIAARIPGAKAGSIEVRPIMIYD